MEIDKTAITLAYYGLIEVANPLGSQTQKLGELFTDYMDVHAGNL